MLCVCYLGPIDKDEVVSMSEKSLSLFIQTRSRNKDTIPENR